jgi:hypothetical protein
MHSIQPLQIVAQVKPLKTVVQLNNQNVDATNYFIINFKWLT